MSVNEESNQSAVEVEKMMCYMLHRLLFMKLWID